MKPTKISHIVMMGDSLSDRGTLDRRKLLGMIPMSELSGLEKRSPLGRFTNGLAWSDLISARIANEFLIEELEEATTQPSEGIDNRDVTDISDDVLDHQQPRPLTPEHQMDSTDVADGIIDQDPRVERIVQASYTLSNDLYVKFQGRDFVRNYDEGGLTAYDYSWMPSKSLSRFASRIILSNLAKKREQLLAYDQQHELSKAHKAQTLVVEWSGANDLITVNERPSYEEVERAVKARIANVEQLIKHGYRHFVLFNLPDLSLTPRYQAKSEEERRNAHDCSLYFNRALEKACRQLAATYPHCSVEVFDVGSLFTEVYENPEQYGFEQDKLKQPYTTSKDFELNADHTSPAPGYMFWDDVHPTASMHALLAKRFYDKYHDEYRFSPPVEEAVQEEELDIDEYTLRASFVAEYEKKFHADQAGFFGRLRRSRINAKEASLVDILKHALDDKGYRTREVITKLQWIDAKGNLNLNIPKLKEAMEALDFQREEESIRKAGFELV